jgi:hypothetical protein
MHILDHYHRWSQRTSKQLIHGSENLSPTVLEQQLFQVGLFKCHIPDRAQGLRGQEIVAATPQNVCILLGFIAEDLDDRCLPYSRLTSDHNDSTGSLARVGKQRSETLENGVSLK